VPILATGHYRVFLFGRDSLYLKSTFLENRDVLRSGFAITESSSVPLTVNVGVASAIIAGRVARSSGEPAYRADVKLISQGVDAPFMRRSAMTDQQGRFHFASVPPADYELVAVDQIVRNRDLPHLNR
jgi:hypothetical protein